MFAINDALAHEIIHASHDSNPVHAARYQSPLHPTAMHALMAAPHAERRRSVTFSPAAMIRQAAARITALFVPARPVEAACCPAPVA